MNKTLKIWVGVCGCLLPLMSFGALDRVAYATNGCVANLDGLDNQGTGVRDGQSSVWVNSANTEQKLAFVRAEGSQSHWTGRGYRFNKSFIEFPEAINLGSEFTIQIALNHNPTVYPKSGNCWPNFLTTKETDCGLYTVNQNDVLNWKIDGLITSTRPKLSGFNGLTINAMVSGGKAYLFQTDTKPASGEGVQSVKSGATGLGAKTFEIGTRNSSASAAAERYVNGEIYAVRLYSRALTDAELTDHLLLDNLRFRNQPPEEGVLQVVSTFPGVQATTKDGVYRMNGDTNLTIGEGSDAAGNTYTCTGYTLETWDATNKVWNKLAESTESDSVTIAAGATKRLLIHWTLKSGKVALGTQAYPQFQLVSFVDGIRNQGATKAHATSGMTWADLMGGSGNLSYTNGFNRSSAWALKGYHFNAGGGFLGQHGVDFTPQVTWQLAVDWNLQYQRGTMEGKTGFFPRFMATRGSDFGPRARVSSATLACSR